MIGEHPKSPLLDRGIDLRHKHILLDSNRSGIKPVTVHLSELLGSLRPFLVAQAAACARVVTPILRYAPRKCAFTVLVLRNSELAI
jgi:hypothetical protein